eukprot:CAMPEP_0176323852 /NCGR_PEP_ID=MMETSP0121_2-20121125/72598_1 /TAXON_ID=160619 /ORGANISM="Kryptoperidinium foliaceum, Strain CCMP 1326" /LENGTH=165 /DNA_ID=CAMNT_0017666379 /DNA_START=18 /DNA_END=512 /DNA_ORIENTATION=+
MTPAPLDFSSTRKQQKSVALSSRCSSPPSASAWALEEYHLAGVNCHSMRTTLPPTSRSKAMFTSPSVSTTLKSDFLTKALISLACSYSSSASLITVSSVLATFSAAALPKALRRATASMARRGMARTKWRMARRHGEDAAVSEHASTRRGRFQAAVSVHASKSKN